MNKFLNKQDKAQKHLQYICLLVIVQAKRTTSCY